MFADPPYDLPGLSKLPDLVLSTSWLETGGIFVLEHGSEHDFSDRGAFFLQKKFGHVHFSFFKQP